MTSMLSRVGRGALAGAAGVTVLNAVTYVDMLLRGRPASSAPEKMVEAAAGRVGLEVPGRGEERQNRVSALGPLAGIVTGVGVGMAAGTLRAAGARTSALVAGPAIGLAAMLLADAPLAAFGVSDPRTWKPADWAADAIPHLAYGLTVHSLLRGTR